MDQQTLLCSSKGRGLRRLRTGGVLGCLFLSLIMQGADLAEKVTANDTNLPLITVRQFLDAASGWGEGRRVRMRGVVTHSISDKTFFIQEGDAATYVFHKPATAFRVGELVEVTGYPSLAFAPTLQHCQTRSLGVGSLPQPLVISAAEARSGMGHMRLVRVQGVLGSERLRGGHTLVLKPSDGGAFTADLEALADLQPFDHLRPGSLLDVTGVCSVRHDPNKRPVSFNVFVRSPADIVVLKPPSWWTPTRTWRVLGLATFGLALALAWVLTLRLQVRRQTAHIREMNEQLERRVRERTAELTEANQELQAFTYSVSHDLRSPLRHISGFAGVVSQHPLVAQTPELQKPLSQITASTTRLGRLMDDLLAFARTARKPLAQQSIALGPLVAEVQRELQHEITGRQVEWEIAPLPEVPGDPATLHLVWQNLLGNALKYSRRRTPAIIQIGCQATGSEWIFSVRDNGAGFDMRYADRLFGIFQRLHHDDEFEGNGIGLANVRRIVQRHGGRIWAEGKVDHGATFHFTLPRRSSDRSSGCEGGISVG